MSMLRFGHAALVTPIVDPFKWVEKKVPAGRVKIARSVIAKYDPSKWLLSHVTIIASVDTEFADPSDKKSNYLIKPEHSVFVNNNGDSWERELLKATYKTFLGADSFVEHVQIPELSKGKVIDVALREVPIGKDLEGKDLTTLYVDILIANNREHVDLIDKIKTGQYNSVSMGCFLAGTEITLSDGTKRLIEDISPGDLVITHKGNKKSVINVQRRQKNEMIFKVSFEGDYKDIYVTKEHPFFSFKRDKLCACGCGESLRVIVRGGKKEFKSGLYKPGHYLRVCNANHKVLNFNDRDKFPIKKDIELSWIEAKDLKKDDFLSYPISSYVENDNNATVDFSILLGYFAAEGSYVKEVSIEGEENDYAVRCRICGRLYNTLYTHLHVHNISIVDYKKTYLDASVKAKYNKNIIRGSSRNEPLEIKGLKKSRRDIGLEFSLGEHEYDTVNKEVFEIGTRLFPKSPVLRYKNCVKIISEEACSLMKEYCGEYSDKKEFSEKVIYWPVEIQKHLVATWFIGDYACTNSKNMSDQFRFILARCGVRYNTYKNEKENYSCIVKIVNGGEITEKVYEGVRKESYLHQINTLGMSAIKDQLTYAFPFKNKKLVDKIYKTSNSYSSYNKGYFLRKIKNIEEIPYEGIVYNLEVEDDNSYIANDVAVHNCLIAYSFCSQCGNKAEDESKLCKHIRYFKHNHFIDKNGIKRIIAELCGSADDPGSCKFIDASWVKKPAFGGALLRNLVEPTDDISEKLNQAMLVPSFQAQPGMLLKAASQAASALVNEIQAQDEPKDEPKAEPKEPAKDDTDFPAAPEGDAPLGLDEPAAETPAGEGAAPEAPAAPEPQIQEPAEDATVKEVEQLFTKNILNKIRRKLLKDEAGVKTPLDEKPIDTESTNDSLIKKSSVSNLIKLAKMSGSERLVNGFMILSNVKNWNSLKKYGYGREDVIGMLHFIDKNMSSEPIGSDAVLALSRIKTASTNPQSFFTDMIIEIGRQPSVKEGLKLIKWTKILSKL
jgi:hypothetical protein